MKVRVLGWCIALALVCATAGRSLADPAADAKQHYIDGQKWYDLGEYDKAIELFKQAYSIEARPGLLFNIAQAYRLSKNFERALFFYNAFLKKVPQANNRAEVERFIAEMRGALEQQQTVSEKPPQGTVDPADPAGVVTTTTTTTTTTGVGGTTQVDTQADPGTKIPSPERSAATQVPMGSEAPELPAERGGGRRPIYKKWWFWAGIGAVAAGTIAIVAVTSGGGEADKPETTFPITPLFQ
ncbi:MAG: tetratricopeptide repeat protein [Deltaproteobacteria bacterium]|nr:tetratricopeptide repeat protein [Deltaproteobacteria bacterium]